MSVTVPFMDLKAQVAPLRSEIDAAIKDVVDNTAFILGPRLEKFCRVLYNSSLCGGGFRNPGIAFDT